MNLSRVRSGVVGTTAAVFLLATCHHPPLPGPKTGAEWEADMRGEDPPQISVDSDGDGIADQDETP